MAAVAEGASGGREAAAEVEPGRPGPQGGADPRTGGGAEAEAGAPPPSGRPREEGAWRIVLATLQGAPRRVRAMVFFMLLAGTVALGFQLLVDTAGRQGPMVAAELLGVTAGTIGALVLGVAYVLHGASQRGVAGCATSGLNLEPRNLHRMLVALPSMGMLSGVLLGTAVGILVVRALLRSPVLLLPAAIYLAMALLAARSVGQTTRFLFRHAREQAEAAARARGEATEAQLAALQAQIHPHFLFNALNTVASLVATDAAAAERAVENLAHVLRRTLARSRRVTTSLAEEVDYLETYLAVEKERWGERLEVVWALQPRALELPVPSLTLQPLVENSLKHGLGERLEGGRLTVGAEVEGSHLVLWVEDDGAGFPRHVREATGLGNLRQRLANLYGDAAELTVERPAAGARVVVRLPVGPPGSPP